MTGEGEPQPEQFRTIHPEAISKKRKFFKEIVTEREANDNFVSSLRS